MSIEEVNKSLEKLKTLPKVDYSKKDELAQKLINTVGHPLYTLSKENEALKSLIEKAHKALDNGWELDEVFNDIRDVSIHYAEKGDLLYPLLKVKYEISGPSDVMWTTDDEIRDDINALADPTLMKGVKEAAGILSETAGSGDRIAVVTDYDCDGIFSGMVLYTGLLRIGAVPVLFTPDRVKDGYGINRRIIDEIYNRGINYIITCDNGIAAYDEVCYAKELGMTVLVTDHHAVPFDDIKGIKIYKESKADAVVNPHQIECSYPYKELCGAAVAWKIVILLYRKIGIDEKEAMDFIENVAFATVGDVMPLTGENRILVKAGLKSIHHTTNIGMK